MEEVAEREGRGEGEGDGLLEGDLAHDRLVAGLRRRLGVWHGDGCGLLDLSQLISLREGKDELTQQTFGITQDYVHTNIHTNKYTYNMTLRKHIHTLCW